MLEMNDERNSMKQGRKPQREDANMSLIFTCSLMAERMP